jgi:hypothetical protein
VVSVVVDDHLLRDILTGERTSDLGGLAPQGVATLGYPGLEMPVRMRIDDRTRRSGRADGAVRFGRFGWVVGVAIQAFRWRQQC